MNERMDFTGRRIWVTGAGRGIGRAVAEGFARLGGEVEGFDLAFPEAGYGFATRKRCNRPAGTCSVSARASTCWPASPASCAWVRSRP